jgi:hypothetical protein
LPSSKQASTGAWLERPGREEQQFYFVAYILRLSFAQLPQEMRTRNLLAVAMETIKIRSPPSPTILIYLSNINQTVMDVSF